MADWRSWTGKNSQDWIWPKLFQITVCEGSKNRVQYLNDKICCLDKVIIYLLASYNLILPNQHFIFCTFSTHTSLQSPLVTYNFLSSKKYEEKSLTSPGWKWRDWTDSFSALSAFLAPLTTDYWPPGWAPRCVLVLARAVVTVVALVGIICSIFYPAPIEHKENFSLFRSHKCYQKRVSAWNLDYFSLNCATFSVRCT